MRWHSLRSCSGALVGGAMSCFAVGAAAEKRCLGRTREVRTSEWTVASAPADLVDRRVEITGPPEPKIAINALNSGARVWLADLEDANTPHWMNVISSQVALADAVRRRLTFESPEGKPYRLNKGRLATVVVRPRGWHLDERHILVDGKPTVGAFVDFGLYFFHNARELLDRGSGCTSICRKPRATSRRGCGMTCSAPPKSSSASQWDHSGHCAHRDDPGRL
jgi:malate synthase A